MDELNAQLEETRQVIRQRKHLLAMKEEAQQTLNFYLGRQRHLRQHLLGHVFEAAVAAADVQHGDELGQAQVQGAVPFTAALMRQRAGEPGLADAGP